MFNPHLNVHLQQKGAGSILILSLENTVKILFYKLKGHYVVLKKKGSCLI